MGESFAAKNIAVQNDIPASLPALTVDKPKFARLFELLFKDEIVCLPAGSQITPAAQPTEESNPDKAEIHLQLSDNGPGLPKEALRLILILSSCGLTAPSNTASISWVAFSLSTTTAAAS